MRISDWSSDVCSSDLFEDLERIEQHPGRVEQHIADPAAEDDADRRVKDEIVGMALGHRRAGLFEQLEQIPPADEDAADIGERIPAQDRVPANREQNGIAAEEIGRASRRERVGQYVEISGDVGSLNKQDAGKL